MCRETAKYQTFCNDVLFVRVYCKVVAPMRVKIVVNTKGVEKIGEKIYHSPPGTKDEDVAVKIREIYKSYYEINQSTSQTDCKV